MKITVIAFSLLYLNIATSSAAIFLKNKTTKILIEKCNIKSNSNFVEEISVTAKQMKCLSHYQRKKNLSPANIFRNFTINANREISTSPSLEDEKVFALAKKEFGLPLFWKKYPLYDGRGVITGVIDDGISPHHSGFRKTTTGDRKYIGHFSHSSAFKFTLTENTTTEINLDGEKLTPNYIVVFDEKKFRRDYNGDSQKTELVFAVIAKGNEGLMCHDLDLDGIYQSNDCQRSFSKSGEYGSWSKDLIVPLMAEIDLS